MMGYITGKFLIWIYFGLLCAAIKAEGKCGVPDDVSNAKLIDDISGSDTFDEGIVLRYECESAYYSTISQNRICQDGQWQTSFQCIRKTCGRLDDPKNGRREGDSYFAGDTMKFHCDEGYELKGTNAMLCRTDRTWRPPTPPTCEPVKCSEYIEYVENGDTFQAAPDGKRNIYQRVVEFRCYDGYDLVGSSRRTCQADGSWSGTQTACIEPSCPDFDELVNGEIYYMNEEINRIYHVAEIKCNDNYDLFPDIPDGYNECVAKDTWEHPEFTCEGRLTVGPGDKMYLYRGTRSSRGRRIYSSTVVKSRTLLTSSCYRNYELYDESTNTYVDKRYRDYKVMDGKLQPNMASCVEERCEVPRRTGTSFYTSDGELVKTGQKIEHGVELQKRCDGRYEDLLQETVKCDKGTLRGSSACTPKRCQIPRGRDAKNKRNSYKTYSADSFVENGVTVYKSCKEKEELYYPDQHNYDHDQKFESECNYGTWTEPTFPVCKEKRCTVYRKTGTSFYTSDGTLVKFGQKIEHGVVLQKKCKDKYEDLKQKEVKCDKGTLRGSSACTPKRCQIPEGRDAIKSGKKREILEEKSFVENGVTVYKRCEKRKELYYPDQKTYADDRKFTSKCDYGTWTEPTFPVCKESRCSLPGDCFCLYTGQDDTTLSGLVEHGTNVTKSCNAKQEFEPEKQRNLRGISFICNSGNIGPFPNCIDKRCTVSKEGRNVTDKDRRTYRPDDLVAHGTVIVKQACGKYKELRTKDTHEYVDDLSNSCVYGEWENDFPECVKKRCEIPNHPGTILIRANKTLQPGHKVESDVSLTRNCEDGYEEKGNRKIKCDRGNLLGLKACVPESCTVPAIRNSKNLEEQIDLKHSETVELSCRKGFYLLKHGAWIPDIQLECTLGDLSAGVDGLECASRCRAEAATGTIYEYPNGTQIEPDQLVQNRTSLAFICTDNHTLSYKNKRTPRLKGNVTCQNGHFVPEFKCVSNSSDKNIAEKGASDENSDKEDDISEADYPGYDDNSVTEASSEQSDATPETTTVAVDASTTGGEDSYEYYNYEYGGDEDEDDENADNSGNGASCTSPKNGNLIHSYLSIYEVTCDEGYTLNVIKIEKQFLCVDGKLQSRRLKLEPVCEEDSCKITSDMSWKMKVFGREKGEKKFYSEGFKFDAGERLYFDCKKKDMEPVNRIFKCIKGQWVGIERGFNMTIDNTDPECRQVDCGKDGCHFGGTCVKDGRCDCPPLTDGDHCEIPKCQANCTLNGGECIRPNTCKCDAPRYGTVCDLVGCSPPSGDQVSIKDQRSVFRRDDILRNIDVTCGDELVLSTTKDFVCSGDDTWATDIACVEGTSYRIEFRVNDHKYAGTWNPMIVSMKTETGTVIGELRFPDAKYPGDIHTGIKQFRYIGKVQEIEITLNTAGRGYDSIVMDQMSITARDEQRHEEYKLTNIHSSRARFSQKIDVACPLPHIDGEYNKNEKRVYFSGDIISSSDIKCNEGLAPILPSVTCQKNGQWTGILACAQEVEYEVTIQFGSDRTAGEYRGELTLKLTDNDGQHQAVWSITGGLERNAKITRDFKAVYIPKITSLDLHIKGIVNPAVQLTTILLKVDKNNDGKEYIFTDIGWVHPTKTISPDRGCQPPSDGLDVLVPNNNYLTNNKLRSDDVRCKDGYRQKASEVTCLKTGEWSDQLCDVPRPELVRGIVITSSSTHSTWEAQRAIDGNTNRAPDSCKCCAATRNQYEPWYKVDLGRLYEVHSLTVLGRGGDGDPGYDQTFENMRITFGQTKYDEEELVSNYRSDYVYNETFVEPKLARYLQLTLVGKTRHFTICELLVYGSQSSRDQPQPRPNDERPDSEKDESYAVKILSTRINRRVSIIIQGKETHTKAMVFSESGLDNAVNEKTIGPIPDIGNVQRVILFRDNGRFNIKYVYLRVQSSGDQYLGSLEEATEQRADIEVHKLYKAGCEGTTYTNGIYGYNQRIQRIQFLRTQSLHDCKSACTRNGRCRAVRFKEWFYECYLFDTNVLSNFAFPHNHIDGKVYFRAC